MFEQNYREPGILPKTDQAITDLMFALEEQEPACLLHSLVLRMRSDPQEMLRKYSEND